MLKPDIAGENREEKRLFILEGPEEQVFAISKPKFDLPEEARSFDSVICEKCGENAPEHKIRIQDGKNVCLDCFEDYDNRW